MLTPAQVSVLLAAFGALADRPRLIAPLVTALAGDGEAPDDSALSGHVRTAEQTDPVVTRFRYLLVSWDACDADWAAGTERNTVQRRQRIYDSLGASDSLRAVLNERLPFAPWQPPSSFRTSSSGGTRRMSASARTSTGATTGSTSSRVWSPMSSRSLMRTRPLCSSVWRTHRGQRGTRQRGS